jgi:protein gp37
VAEAAHGVRQLDERPLPRGGPDDFISRVFDVMARRAHTFQVLTKRPERLKPQECRVCHGSGQLTNRRECFGCDGAGSHRPAFFFKQWGGLTPKSGGRLLDGRTWDEMPERVAS